jgi:hypothetical protein
MIGRPATLTEPDAGQDRARRELTITRRAKSIGSLDVRLFDHQPESSCGLASEIDGELVAKGHGTVTHAKREVRKDTVTPRQFGGCFLRACGGNTSPGWHSPC